MFEQRANTSELSEALSMEHEVLTRVHEILSRALPPDSGMSDSDIVNELWKIAEFDSKKALGAGAEALRKVDHRDPHVVFEDS